MDQDLDAAARRRFWLLRILIERHGHPQDALEHARRMERFISGAPLAAPTAATTELRFPTQSGVSPNVTPAAKQAADALASITSRMPGDPLPTSPGRVSETAAPPPAGQTGAVDRARFAQAVADGASNAELARMFGLKPRQANCLRLGLMRTRLSPRSGSRPSRDNAPAHTRETELRMQETFLQQRGRAADTIEDVIRFLRQRGDSIIQSSTNSGAYIVNLHLALSVDQLSRRANQQRALLGQPSFVIEPGAPLRVVSNQRTRPDGTALTA
jgi:hypothetical protein